MFTSLQRVIRLGNNLPPTKNLYCVYILWIVYKFIVKSHRTADPHFPAPPLSKVNTDTPSCRWADNWLKSQLFLLSLFTLLLQKECCTSVSRSHYLQNDWAHRRWKEGIIRMQEMPPSSSEHLSRVQEILAGSAVSWAHSRKPSVKQKLDFSEAVNPVSFLGQIITHYWY